MLHNAMHDSFSEVVDAVLALVFQLLRIMFRCALEFQLRHIPGSLDPRIIRRRHELIDMATQRDSIAYTQDLQLLGKPYIYI